MNFILLKNILLFIALISCLGVSADELHIDSFELERESEAIVVVHYMATEKYIGFQTQISLPDGLICVPEGQDYASLPVTVEDGEHILCSHPDGNRINVVGFSTVNKPYHSLDTLFTFKVMAAPDFEGGEIEITNTVFSTIDHEDVRFGDVSARCDVSVFDNVDYVTDSDRSTGLFHIKYCSDGILVTVDAIIDTHIELINLSGMIVSRTFVEEGGIGSMYLTRNQLLPGSYIVGIVSNDNCIFKKVLLR